VSTAEDRRADALDLAREAAEHGIPAAYYALMDPPPARERLIRPCLTHAHEVNDLSRADDHPAAVDLAESCRTEERCLITHPETGEWVTCPSNAAPR
jgi:hypothetical protein